MFEDFNRFSRVTGPRASGGTPTPVGNPNTVPENGGFQTDGGATAVAGHASSFNKSNYVTVATAAADWAGFTLWLWSTSNGRFLVDVRIDGTIFAVQNLFYFATTTPVAIPIPVAVGAGQTIEVRHQCTSGNITLNACVVGDLAASTEYPGFSAGESIIAASTGDNRPSATDIPTSSSGPTWTQINAATSRAYGAVLFTVAANATNPATGQDVTPLLGVGAASSEVELGRYMTWAFATSGGLILQYRLLRRSIASGARVAAGVLATTTGDNFRFNVNGFY